MRMRTLAIVVAILAGGCTMDQHDPDSNDTKSDKGNEQIAGDYNRSGDYTSTLRVINGTDGVPSLASEGFYDFELSVRNSISKATGRITGTLEVDDSIAVFQASESCVLTVEFVRDNVKIATDGTCADFKQGASATFAGDFERSPAVIGTYHQGATTLAVSLEGSGSSSFVEVTMTLEDGTTLQGDFSDLVPFDFATNSYPHEGVFLGAGNCSILVDFNDKDTISVNLGLECSEFKEFQGTYLR